MAMGADEPRPEGWDDMPEAGAEALERLTDVPAGGLPAWLAETLNFCTRCGATLRFGPIDGDHRERLVCPACNFIAYVNPRLVVTTLPITEHGEVVLEAEVRVERRPVRQTGETEVTVELDRHLGVTGMITVTISHLAEDAGLGPQVDRPSACGHEDEHDGTLQNRDAASCAHLLAPPGPLLRQR